MVELRVLGLWLDLIILKIISILNDSVILCYTTEENKSFCLDLQTTTLTKSTSNSNGNTRPSSAQNCVWRALL